MTEPANHDDYIARNRKAIEVLQKLHDDCAALIEKAQWALTHSGAFSSRSLLFTIRMDINQRREWAGFWEHQGQSHVKTL